MGGIIENIEEPNPIVYLDITIDEEKVGRIIIELFKNICPKTAESFRVLCTGERGVGRLGRRLHYKGTIFHKVVPECFIQGGDIINNNGSGSDTIYGPMFDDENFTLNHTYGGEVTTANQGKPNTNTSQFCITTVPCPHLDGAHTVFGRVRKGLGVAKEVSYVPVGPKEFPIPVCRIADCGEIRNGEDWGINENDGTGDVLPPFPTDWDRAPEDINAETLVEIATIVKNSGNFYFKNGFLNDASRKYKKVLRYVTWYKQYLKKRGSLDRAVLFKELELHCNLNCALVKLKKKLYREALHYCAVALKIDNQSAKALCRRGQANFGLNNYDLAMKDFEAALAISPKDPGILNEICKLNKAKADYLKVEKVTFARMFKP